MPEQYSNLQNASADQATLASTLSAGATSATLTSGHGARFPSSGYFTIRIDDEIIRVGARSGDTLSGLTRAFEAIVVVGAVDATHSAGAGVNQILSAESLAQLPPKFASIYKWGTE